MNKKKKRLIIIAFILATLIAFIVSPLFPYLRSLVVMSVYSRQCEKSSLMEKENIELDIPTGKNWYPFVMTYTADSSFSDYINIPDAKLTILYNFPAFSIKKGCSRLFDEASPYYSSFYGAYLIQRADNIPYGFSPDTLKIDSRAVSNIAKFDFFTLVLSDFGLEKKDQVFDYQITSEETGLSFAGSEGWARVSSEIIVNGVNHKKDGFVTSYLQYGSPKFPASSDFVPIKMNGIIYAKYFEAWNTSVFFYVLSPSEEVCKNCERLILSQSTLNGIG